ncbi:MAG TPA: hypothetical protein VF220_01480 [Nitrososphaeraceae archaeon]
MLWYNIFVNNKIEKLKQIEAEAKQQIKNLPGRWYEGRDQDIETLQKVIIDANIERLKTELYNL